MSFFRRGSDEDERVTETYTSTDYDRGYGGYGGPRRDEERVTESSTYYSSDNVPPPPQVPWPWRPRWDDREGRYFFVSEQTGERTWDLPGRRGYAEETTTTTTDYYDDRGAPRYGGPAYGGGGDRVYQSEQVVEERGEKSGGGHGLMYGALGAAAGLAGGAFLAHEAGNVEDRFEEDKDRVEEGVENFPENAAEWTGRKVGEVESIPQDIGQGFDNIVDDVEDAPEDVANWTGRKVGDVEQFGDNIDNAYDEGRYEGRNDGW